MRISGVLPILAVLYALPSPARGAEPRVVILPVVHNLPGTVDAVVAAVRANVAASLEAAGYAVVAEDEALACVPAAPGPADLTPISLGGVAEACGVEASVGIGIDASGIGYALAVSLTDADGNVVGSNDASCDFCAESEMVDRWLQVAAGLPPPPPALVSRAAGAREGSTEPVGPDVGPVELPPDVPFDAGDGSSPAVPWWFWAGTGGVVAAVAAGVALVVIDGDPTCDGPLTSCPDIYDTDIGGWVLTAVGAAGAAALGIGLYLVLGSEDEPFEEPGASGGDLIAAFGPGGVVFAGTFGP